MTDEPDSRLASCQHSNCGQERTSLARPLLSFCPTVQFAGSFEPCPVLCSTSAYSVSRQVQVWPRVMSIECHSPLRQTNTLTNPFTFLNSIAGHLLGCHRRTFQVEVSNRAFRRRIAPVTGGPATQKGARRRSEQGCLLSFGHDCVLFYFIFSLRQQEQTQTIKKPLLGLGIRDLDEGSARLRSRPPPPSYA